MLLQSTDMPSLPPAPQVLRHGAAMKGVSLSRGTAFLFSGLDIEIQSGDLLWVGGDNGIGKSSLLRLLAGFTQPDDGVINWTLEDTPCPPSDLAAYQGHMDGFKPRLTPAEALKFWASIMDKPDMSGALLARVGLTARAHVPCGQLSAGQKRRLSLARLLLSDKPLWILDEPTAAMDANGTALIEQLIRAHITRGGSAVIASHNAPQINGHRTRRILLKAETAA